MLVINPIIPLQNKVNKESFLVTNLEYKFSNFFLTYFK